MTEPSRNEAERREDLTEAARRMRHAMTPSEAALWERLRDHRLHELHFHRQERVGVFIVDFRCRRARLAVEVDGGIHEKQTERDAERDRWLLSKGWQVLRFPNADVTDRLANVLRIIGQTAQRRIEEKERAPG